MTKGIKITLNNGNVEHHDPVDENNLHVSGNGITVVTGGHTYEYHNDDIKEYDLYDVKEAA